MKRINQAGLELIKEFEGFRACAYIFLAGKQTIGYGHVILPNEGYLKTRKIDPIEATDLLRQDVAKSERAVTKYIDVELNDNQFSALCLFTFTSNYW